MGRVQQSRDARAPWSVVGMPLGRVAKMRRVTLLAARSRRRASGARDARPRTSPRRWSGAAMTPGSGTERRRLPREGSPARSGARSARWGGGGHARHLAPEQREEEPGTGLGASGRPRRKSAKRPFGRERGEVGRRRMRRVSVGRAAAWSAATKRGLFRLETEEIGQEWQASGQVWHRLRGGGSFDSAAAVTTSAPRRRSKSGRSARDRAGAPRGFRPLPRGRAHPARRGRGGSRRRDATCLFRARPRSRRPRLRVGPAPRRCAPVPPRRPTSAARSDSARVRGPRGTKDLLRAGRTLEPDGTEGLEAVDRRRRGLGGRVAGHARALSASGRLRRSLPCQRSCNGRTPPRPRRR